MEEQRAYSDGLVSVSWKGIICAKGSRFIPLHASTGPIPLLQSAFAWHNETSESRVCDGIMTDPQSIYTRILYPLCSSSHSYLCVSHGPVLGTLLMLR